MNPCFILRRFTVQVSKTYSLSYSCIHHQLFTMSIPSFNQMQKCMVPVWKNKEYQKDILWAGIFGSVARNRDHIESDVDILIVLKEHERSGEPIDLRESELTFRYSRLLLSNTLQTLRRPVNTKYPCCVSGKDLRDWAWGYVRLEALLSCRSVYGNRADVEHLRRQAVDYTISMMVLNGSVLSPKRLK